MCLLIDYCMNAVPIAKRHVLVVIPITVVNLIINIFILVCIIPKGLYQDSRNNYVALILANIMCKPIKNNLIKNQQLSKVRSFD